MRIREFIPESWWNDLDPDFLSMMGYSVEPQQEEIASDLASEVSQDVKKIRQSH